MVLRLKTIDETPELEQKFRGMCLYYAELVAQEGVVVKPFRSPDLPIFSTLSDEKKREAISDLQTALEIFEEVRSEGHALSNSPRLLWRGLAKFGWIPQPDIFDKIGNGDLFHIYSATQKFLFSNVDLFRWLSYSLEDLFCGLWFRMIRRDNEMTMRLYEAAMEALTGARMQTFDPRIPEHLCEEVDSPGMLRFWFLVKYCSPLKKGDEIVGFIAVCRCRPVQ